ncbi:FMN-dependent NADH-azoreductase [Periweissella cryptocerci]|uniref:FMN dependent NADH:quinone oxidoreductase n=1 Tax=Periweissella cryptocerci TaxID=2506420 RepID=A0A4P6YRI8_9LACO|nr:NAD(P)H-dependent oxidoreductase [Periweissella cryptocerci]QBO35213.1 FMN-dependent NADH-azoreductase [Periweissella cryptocerci]
MKTLLYVDAHPLTAAESKTLQVADAFVAAWQTANPTGHIETLKLSEANIPTLDKDVFGTWLKQKKIGLGAPLAMSADENALLSQFNTLIDQFVNADVVVFANPMWNHFLPAILKQYLDDVLQAGVAFKYTAHGPVGLLSDKQIIHIQSAGGVYDHTSMRADFGDAYLQAMVEFIGLSIDDEYHTIFIEGADSNPAQRDAIITAAKTEAQNLAVTL